MPTSPKMELEVLPLAPTWLSRADLFLFDEDEFDKDWDFTPIFLPNALLSSDELVSLRKSLEQTIKDEEKATWNSEWIFPDIGETLVAFKGDRVGCLRTNIHSKSLLGFVSFRRSCTWSQDVYADEPAANFEPNHLYLHYEPKLIYVLPSQRGNRVGTALMHALGWAFAEDLKNCLRYRPAKIEPAYYADYDSIAGGRVGQYCVGEFENTIDSFRESWGWLVDIADLEVDGGF